MFAFDQEGRKKLLIFKEDSLVKKKKHTPTGIKWSAHQSVKKNIVTFISNNINQ